jgi:hypothetical protein
MLLMPRISSFFGIVITMYHDEGPHPGRPHFHASYGSEEASFDIETLELIVGALPARARHMVTEWAEAHRAELRANWTRAREHLPLQKIEPLS